MLRGQPRVRDRCADRVTETSARDAADDRPGSTVGGDRRHQLVAERDGPWIVEDEAAQALRTPRSVGERGAAEEVLVAADGEAEAGRVRVRLTRDVGAPGAIALLEAHRIDGAIPAGDETQRFA